MSSRLLRSLAVVALLAATTVVARSVLAPARADDEKAAARAFTDTFGEDPKDLGPTGRNTYFILEPGYDVVLAGDDKKGVHHELAFLCLKETRTIDGVETRVVEERETKNGEPDSLSRNFFAFSKRTGNVYYFGEEEVGEDGKAKPAKSSWLAGEKGARYGLLVPATPLLGARYYEEIASNAKDRAEVISISEKLDTKAGKFEHVLQLEETSAVEPDEKETKLFAPGVGPATDGCMTLVRYGVGAYTAAEKK